MAAGGSATFSTPLSSPRVIMDLLHPITACTDKKAMGSAYYDAEAGRYVLLGYAILITFAGTLAWVKARSRIEVMSAVVSFICLFVAFGISWTYPIVAFAIAAIVAANVAINDALRLQESRQIFPTGITLVISVGSFVFFCILAANAPTIQSSRGGGDNRHLGTKPFVDLKGSSVLWENLSPVFLRGRDSPFLPLREETGRLSLRPRG